MTTLESQLLAIAGPKPTRAVRTFATLSAIELARELSPVNFLVEALGIGVGAPALVCGYGFSGKTLACQDLALAVAGGVPFLGVYRARRGRVLHLDYEQGARITTERYQRLALAHGLDLPSLGDALRVAVHPEVRVNDSDAGDVLARAFDGVALCIIDSLRACAPGVDENSSEVREIIDLANRASEKTGTTVVFIHHARKPSKDADADPTYAIRGSGGIFDAAGSAFVFQGTKGGPVTVHHQKCRNRGTLVESFGLAIENVEIDGDPTAGLRVRHLDPAQMVVNAPTSSAFHGQRQDIVKLLDAGPFLGPAAALFERVRGRKQTFHAALGELEAQGVVVPTLERGKKVGFRLAASSETPEPDGTDGNHGSQASSQFPPLGCGTGNQTGGAP